MRNKQKDIPVAGAKDNAPVAPDNLWELIDADYQSHVPPPDTFTILDVVARYNISYMVATGMVERMMREGKVELIGKFGNRYTKHYRVKE